MDNIKLGNCPCCDKEIEIIEGKVVEVEKPDLWNIREVDDVQKIDGPYFSNGIRVKWPEWTALRVFLNRGSKNQFTFRSIIDHETKTIYIGKERIE